MFGLFTRTRPMPVEPSAPDPDSELWPESWMPEGVTVSERYHNLALAVVLVYTTDASGSACAVSCLGCHFQSNKDNRSTYSSPYSLDNASKVANEHASTCRALPRPLPDRPDDATARELLRTQVRGMRRREENVILFIHAFDLGRLRLQRTKEWIETELHLLADDDPGLLRTGHSEYSGRLDLLILHQPGDRS
jgi:hypothetical protein